MSETAMETAMETATFGAGCFWGVEIAFQRLAGVLETAVGYAGGTLENPTYKDVCSGNTYHAEVVEILFDPKKISYTQVLDAFFSLHDPTQKDRQGPDWGTQYRSVIFFHSPEQQQAAQTVVERLTREHKFSKPIVTLVVPAQTFWRAEEYHQKYLEKRGMASCHI